MFDVGEWRSWNQARFLLYLWIIYERGVFEMKKEKWDGIIVLEKPVKVDEFEWLIAHPNCDTIEEMIPGTHTMYVYAYSKPGVCSFDVFDFRDREYPGKEVLMGMTPEGIHDLVYGRIPI